MIGIGIGIGVGIGVGINNLQKIKVTFVLYPTDVFSELLSHPNALRNERRLSFSPLPLH